ncbi:DUF2997 domain-containing protein [Methanogenium cariaci]|jgi:DUF2997 family protein|uniref:DUF2997 domain-containing protein n=1 Tax=Methanogenium cariaci TaxID=2197 RepID=UPI00078309F7|nr:DUF2997 domain-containing protein [Methanogenium cariaci]
MMSEEITIEIDENGEIFIETNGIKGPACIAQVEELLKELAIVSDTNKSDEYYMENSTLVRQKDMLRRSQK